MADHRRFHLAAPPEGDLARVVGDEAFHAVKVFRVREGDRVTLFDGTGVEYQGVVERAARGAVEVRVLSSERIDREPPLAVTVAAAVPKSAHFDDAVRSACELGLAAFLPIETERTLVRASEHRVERWRKIAIEASKQSRRTRVTRILDSMRFMRAIESPPASGARGVILHAGDEAATPFRAIAEAAIRDSVPLLVLVGPEGDFTPGEVAAATASGFAPARLGRSTLRSETALVAAVAAAVLAPSPP
jgi:16S rRNA (uracil1498-N3)-methyltransferase